MTNREIADRIAIDYPKHSKAALSLALRSSETGVRLTPKAERIYLECKGFVRKTENRKKCVRFSARLSDETAAAVMEAMQREGYSTVQALIEALLLDWLKTKNSAPDAGTPGAEKKGTNCD